MSVKYYEIGSTQPLTPKQVKMMITGTCDKCSRTHDLTNGWCPNTLQRVDPAPISFNRRVNTEWIYFTEEDLLRIEDYCMFGPERDRVNEIMEQLEVTGNITPEQQTEVVKLTEGWITHSVTWPDLPPEPEV